MEKDIIRFKCPHCQHPLAVKRPENAAMVRLTCPKCTKTLNIKIQDKPIKLPPQGDQQLAKLVVVDGPQTDRPVFALHAGSNIVGRSDEGTVQDIAINGDNTISRRSVDLQVGQTTGGYSYHLRVLKAANPVMVNNTTLRIGSSALLHTGDTITMGCTKLMLK